MSRDLMQYVGYHPKQKVIFDKAMEDTTAFGVRGANIPTLVYFTSPDGKKPVRIGIIKPAQFYERPLPLRTHSGYAPGQRCVVSADIDTDDPEAAVLIDALPTVLASFTRCHIEFVLFAAHRPGKFSWHFHAELTHDDHLIVFNYLEEYAFWRAFVAAHPIYQPLIDMQAGHLKRNNGRLRAGFTAKNGDFNTLLRKVGGSLPPYSCLMNVTPEVRFLRSINGFMQLEVSRHLPSTDLTGCRVPPFIQHLIPFDYWETSSTSPNVYYTGFRTGGSTCCVTRRRHHNNRQKVIVSRLGLRMHCMHPDCSDEWLSVPCSVPRLPATTELHQVRLNPYSDELCFILNAAILPAAPDPTVVFLESGLGTGKSHLALSLMRTYCQTRRILYMVTRIAEGEDIYRRLQERDIPVFFYRADTDVTRALRDESMMGVCVITPNQLQYRLGLQQPTVFDYIILDEFSTLMETLVTASTIPNKQVTCAIFFSLCKCAGTILCMDAAILEGYSHFFLRSLNTSNYQCLRNTATPRQVHVDVTYDFSSVLDEMSRDLLEGKKIAVAVTSKSLLKCIERHMKDQLTNVDHRFYYGGDSINLEEFEVIQFLAYSPVITSGVDIKLRLNPFERVYLIIKDSVPMQGPNLLSAIQMMGRVRGCDEICICCPVTTLRDLDMESCNALLDWDMFSDLYLKKLLAEVRGQPLSLPLELDTDGIPVLQKDPLIAFWQTSWQLMKYPLAWMVGSELRLRGYTVTVRPDVDIGANRELARSMGDLRTQVYEDELDMIIENSNDPLMPEPSFVNDLLLQEDEIKNDLDFISLFLTIPSEVAKRRLVLYMSVFGRLQPVHISSDRHLMVLRYDLAAQVVDHILTAIDNQKTIKEMVAERSLVSAYQDLPWRLWSLPLPAHHTKRYDCHLKWFVQTLEKFLGVKPQEIRNGRKKGDSLLVIDEEKMQVLEYVASHCCDKNIVLYR